MKKLFLLAIPVLAIAIFAFATPSNSTGVTRVGEHLYQIEKDNKISEEDNQAILSIVKDEYGIVEFENCSDGPGLKLAAKGGSTVEWYSHRWDVLHKSTKWDDVASTNANLAKLEQIYSKYVDAGATAGGKQ